MVASQPMGMFSSIMTKIFGAPAKAAPTPEAATAPAAPASAPATAAPAAPATPVATTPAAVAAAVVSTATIAADNVVAAAPLPEVDVTAILDGLAAHSSEKGLDWKKSIVDLMKLVGIDSSLHARQELAKELHYSGDLHDSASMNIWLHKEVIKKIVENGGKVPAGLIH
jgi:Domain of unknown function (DUF3597)